MSSFVVGVLDSEKRARDKQASRDSDRLRRESGAVGRAQLRRENGFFSSLPLHTFRIVAIGGRPIRQLRRADNRASSPLESPPISTPM